MRSSRLRHRIEIQKLVMGEPDPNTGHSKNEWVNIFGDGIRVPAEVLDGAGREPFMAGTIQAETDARITFRHFAISRADLMKCRIVYQGIYYDVIDAARDATLRREWRVRCKEGANDG